MTGALNLIGIRDGKCFIDILEGRVKLEQVKCIFIRYWEMYRVDIGDRRSREEYVRFAVRNSLRYRYPRPSKEWVDGFLLRSEVKIRDIALKLVAPGDHNRGCDPFRVKKDAVVRWGECKASFGDWVDLDKGESIVWKLNPGA